MLFNIRERDVYTKFVGRSVLLIGRHVHQVIVCVRACVREL